MIALGLSIVVSTLLFSCFRLFPKYGVRLEEADRRQLHRRRGHLAGRCDGPAFPCLGHGLAVPSTCGRRRHGADLLSTCFEKIGECTQQLGLGRRGHRHQDVHGAAHDGVHVPGPQ